MKVGPKDVVRKREKDVYNRIDEPTRDEKKKSITIWNILRMKFMYFGNSKNIQHHHHHRRWIKYRILRIAIFGGGEYIAAGYFQISILPDTRTQII